MGGVGLAGFLWFWVNIRCFGCGGWRFRPYGESPFSDAGMPAQQKGNPKGLTPAYGPSLRLGVPSLRDSSGGGGASPTVCFAAPPLDVFGCAKRSLRSHPRINPSTQPAEGAGTSKAVLELTLIVLSGEKQRRMAFAFVGVGLPTKAA